MYPEIADVEKYGATVPDKRPFISVEYSHAMGNSNGCLKEFWDVTKRHRNLQGGFIWDWVEQGLREFTPDGQSFFAYGGDYGDQPNDQNFNCNGLVMPDREPKPAMAECAKLFQPVRFSRSKDHSVAIFNERFFADLDDLAFDWECLADGLPCASGALDVPPTAARSKSVVALPELPHAGGSELTILIRARSRSATAWAAAGHILAWEQFRISKPAFPRPSTAAAAHSPRAWFEQNAACITALPELHVIRGFTDNDGVKANRNHWERPEKLLAKARIAGLLDLAVSDLTTRERGTTWTRRRVYSAPQCADAFTLTERFSCRSDNWLKVTTTIEVNERLSDLPRIGVALQLATTYNRMEWYGLGPVETYPDRKAGAWLGRFSCTVADACFPYIAPQESGYREDLRWLALRDADGNGLLVTADKPFSGSALPFSSTELLAASHPHKLPQPSATHLNIDAAMRGLGTASCGPDTLPRYQIPAGSYRLTYLLRPLLAGDDIQQLMRA
jgi:beta-galactosidase